MVGVGLAAASGFRLFIPLLIAGLAIRFGFKIPWIESANYNLLWLGSMPAILCFLVAAVVEVLAYKILIVDHFLDLLTTPASIAIGSILVATFLQGVENPLLKLAIAVIFGGGAAGIVQASTAALRLVSTKTTGGIANPVLSAGEAIASAFFSIVAVLVPLLVIAWTLS